MKKTKLKVSCFVLSAMLVFQGVPSYAATHAIKPIEPGTGTGTSKPIEDSGSGTGNRPPLNHEVPSGGFFPKPDPEPTTPSKPEPTEPSRPHYEPGERPGSGSTGTGNTGTGSTGSGNTGSGSTGTGSTGSGSTGSGSTGTGNTGTGSTGSGNTGSGSTGSGSSGSGSTGSGSTGSGSTGTGNTGTGSTGSGNTESGSTGSGSTGSGSTGSGSTGSGSIGSGSTGTGNTGTGSTGSGNTESGSTGSGSTGSGSTGSGSTGSGSTGSGSTGSGSTGTGNTGSGNTGLGNTGSGNTGSGNAGISDNFGGIGRPNRSEIIGTGKPQIETGENVYVIYNNAIYNADLTKRVYSLTDVPNKEGYKFIGWTTKEGKNVDLKNNVLPNRTVIHATWEKISFKVLFEANGGSLSKKSKDVERYQKFGALPIPQRKGYTFLGWYTKESLGNKVFSSSKVNISNDITLYAYWRVNKVQNIVAKSQIVKLGKGNQKKINFTVKPVNANKNLQWFTSNKQIATITKNGMVKAKAVGTVVVTAKDNITGKKATCLVVIK